MSSTRECQVCRSMQPRLITQASAAALSITAKTVECPLGKRTNCSPT